MPSAFENAFSDSSFKLLELKENETNTKLSFASDLCQYINTFLPLQLNSGKNEEIDSDNEDLEYRKGTPILSFGKASRAKTIEELHKRIETLKGKKGTYKDKLLKKGLKNRLKKKQKLEERKQIKNAARKQDKKEGSEPNEVKPEIDDGKLNKETDTELQFSKLIVSPVDINKKKHIDPKRMLQKVEKENKKLKHLEVKGKKEKLQEIKTKKTWDVAIQKAEGVKIKDDVELLKKSVSKIKQRKAKSKKKWEERENALKHKKEDAQKKRQENINKKKQERKKKRTKVLVKKGRILPR